MLDMTVSCLQAGYSTSLMSLLASKLSMPA
ncbi:uncharacterized protein FFB14_09503 [Fusarium fujikuroi]|nr:uncharacterized protein FFB14_09503 [Fusarium fujikuroi]